MFHPDLIRHPDGCPALVLNADYTPLSYYPLSVWPWITAPPPMPVPMESFPWSRRCAAPGVRRSAGGPM